MIIFPIEAYFETKKPEVPASLYVKDELRLEVVTQTITKVIDGLIPLMRGIRNRLVGTPTLINAMKKWNKILDSSIA